MGERRGDLRERGAREPQVDEERSGGVRSVPEWGGDRVQVIDSGLVDGEGGEVGELAEGGDGPEYDTGPASERDGDGVGEGGEPEGDHQGDGPWVLRKGGNHKTGGNPQSIQGTQGRDRETASIALPWVVLHKNGGNRTLKTQGIDRGKTQGSRAHKRHHKPTGLAHRAHRKPRGSQRQTQGTQAFLWRPSQSGSVL